LAILYKYCERNSVISVSDLTGEPMDAADGDILWKLNSMNPWLQVDLRNQSLIINMLTECIVT
jgi:hypothetical protein